MCVCVGGGLKRFYGYPTLALIFRRGIKLENINQKILYKILNIIFYLFSIFYHKTQQEKRWVAIKVAHPITNKTNETLTIVPLWDGQQ